jgi:hypothetical protein
MGRGRAALRAGDRDERLDGSPTLRGYTQHEYARMLIRRGAPDDDRRASELLRAACGGYEQLGMTAWQASAVGDLATFA